MASINNEEIKKDVKNIISKISRIDVKKIFDHTSLRDDLYIDSLQATQIITLIQDKYNIKIDEVEIFNVDSIIDVVELVKEYKNSTPSS